MVFKLTSEPRERDVGKGMTASPALCIQESQPLLSIMLTEGWIYRSAWIMDKEQSKESGELSRAAVVMLSNTSTPCRAYSLAA